MKPSSWAFAVARAYLARATSPDDYDPMLAARIYDRYYHTLHEVARYLQQERADMRKFLEE